jgi:hypothetical protein
MNTQNIQNVQNVGKKLISESKSKLTPQDEKIKSKQLVPLNTENMIMKPITEKNTTIRIDLEGIYRCK